MGCHEHGEDAIDAPLPLVAFAIPTDSHVGTTDDGLAIALGRDDEAFRVWLDEPAIVSRTERLPADEG